jgi:peptidoglycan/xylan/chitin deacetylase (PgdA/CDA1 family)
MVSDEQVPHVKHLYQYRNIRQFTKDLDFFLAHYQPVTLNELLEHLDRKRSLPKRCFHLTFDDGFREMHDVVAPILRAKGVPATFFLTTGFIDNLDMAHHNKLSLLVEHLARAPSASIKEQAQVILARNGVSGDSFASQMVSVRYRQRHLVTELAALCGFAFGQYLSSCKPYLSSDQIRSLLEQGFAIGAHSLDHPLYADLPWEEQVRQTHESMQLLVDRFQIGYRAFAFPHNDQSVTPEFFEELFQNRQLAVSFSTDGMVKHFFARNLARFSMEKTALPARHIVARQYAVSLLRKAQTRGSIRNQCR